jgi:hypothetical protein
MSYKKYKQVKNMFRNFCLLGSFCNKRFNYYFLGCSEIAEQHKWDEVHYMILVLSLRMRTDVMNVLGSECGWNVSTEAPSRSWRARITGTSAASAAATPRGGQHARARRTIPRAELGHRSINCTCKFPRERPVVVPSRGTRRRRRCAATPCALAFARRSCVII